LSGRTREFTIFSAFGVTIYGRGNGHRSGKSSKAAPQVVSKKLDEHRLRRIESEQPSEEQHAPIGSSFSSATLELATGARVVRASADRIAGSVARKIRKTFSAMTEIANAANIARSIFMKITGFGKKRQLEKKTKLAHSFFFM
jgi:hypothetical protein